MRLAAAHRCLSRASAKMTVGSTFSLKHGATGASRSVFGEMGMRVQPSQFALQKTQIPVDFSRLFGDDAVPRRLYSTTPTPVAESSTKAEGSKAHQTHEEAKENGKEHKHKRQSFGPSSIEPFVSNISKVIMVNRKLFKWFLILSGVSISGMFYILYNYPQVRDAICFGVQGSIRFLSCLTTGAAIAFDYKWSLRGLTPEEKEEKIKEVHLRAARKLLDLFRRNAGIFVKFGQHLSALDYLLPEQYTSTMSVLQADAPQKPFADIVDVIIKELGAHPDVVFEEFERTPIGTASLAQVYKAKYKGKMVAVKVQFPGLRETCIGDSYTIGFLCNLCSDLFPDFQLKWLIDEINKNLPLELDFLHEARNSERVSRNFRSMKEFKSPDILWSLTTDRVLTMEYMDGVSIRNLEGIKKYGIEPKALSEKVTEIFAQMIFKDGFVHCDPHPGNILVRPDPNKSWSLSSLFWWRPKPFQVVLLDHGLYRELEPVFRENYLNLWDALINFNEQKIELYAEKVGAPDPKVLASMLTLKTWQSLSTKPQLQKGSARESNDVLKKAADENFLMISRTLATVKSELLLLFKTNDLLRSINFGLGEPINPTIVTAQIVSDIIHDKQSAAEPNILKKVKIIAHKWLVKAVIYWTIIRS